MTGQISKYGHLVNMAPLLVQVELTEACNLSCRFCYNSQQPRYSEHVFRILERLAEQEVMQVTLTGGEPLLHPDFFAILKRACELFPNVMILSNGTLMDEEAVARIHEHDILSVSVSVHGDPRSHDALTCVSGSYAKAINAIRLFLKRGTIPIASNFVLTASNLSRLANTIWDLRSVGLQFLTITRFVPVGIGGGAEDLLVSRRQLVDAFRTINSHLASGNRPHVEVAEATPFCALPAGLRSLANTCSYGYDRFYVDVDGNMMVCGLSRIPLGGNVLETNIRNIKAGSSTFQTFVEDRHLPEACVACGEIDQCHGGCRAAAMVRGEWDGGYDCHMPRALVSD